MRIVKALTLLPVPPPDVYCLLKNKHRVFSHSSSTRRLLLISTKREAAQAAGRLPPMSHDCWLSCSLPQTHKTAFFPENQPNKQPPFMTLPVQTSLLCAASLLFFYSLLSWQDTRAKALDCTVTDELSPQTPQEQWQSLLPSTICGTPANYKPPLQICRINLSCPFLLDSSQRCSHCTTQCSADTYCIHVQRFQVYIQGLREHCEKVIPGQPERCSAGNLQMPL